MASQTEIVNMALIHLGQAPVTSLNLDAIGQAGRKVMAVTEQARDDVLGGHDWIEAMETVIPKALSVDDVPVQAAGGYPFVYVLPQGFVRAGGVAYQFGYSGGWRVGIHTDVHGHERRVLFAAQALSTFSFVKRVAWESLSSPLVLLISLRMAWLACVAAADATVRGLKGDLESQYQSVWAEAVNQEMANCGGDDPIMAGMEQVRYFAR